MEKLLIFVIIILSCFSCEEKPGNSPSQKEDNQSSFCDSITTKNLVALITSLKSPTSDLDSVIRRFELNRPDDGLCRNFTIDSTYAKLFDEIGKKLLNSNRNTKARDHFNKALSIRKKIFDNAFHRDILRMYYNIGTTYFNEREYHDAISYYNSSGLIIHSHFHRVYFLSNLKLGECYTRINEHDKALQFFNNAEKYSSIHAISQVDRINLTRSLALNYRLTKRYSYGITITRKILDPIIHEEKTIKNKQLANLSGALGNLWQDSLLYASDKEEVLDSAIFYFEKAMEYYNTMEPGKERDQLQSLTVGNLGEMYRRGNKLDKAERILSTTLSSIDWQSDLKERQAQLFINRGEVYFDLKQFHLAASDFDIALNLLVPKHLIGDNSLPLLDSTILNKNYLLLLLNDISINHLALFEQKSQGHLHHLTRANAVYDSLFKLINRLRGDFISDDAKLKLAKESQPVLQNAFSTCLKLYQKTKDEKYWKQAFNIAEQSKAFALLEAARLKNVSNNLLPDETRKYEQTLLDERTKIEETLLKANGNIQRSKAIENRKAQNFEDIRKFQIKLKNDHPKYYKLKYSGADLTIEEIQKNLLGSDQALLEYFQEDSTLNIFVIRKDTFLVRTIPNAKEKLDKTIVDFREAINIGEAKNLEMDFQFIRTGYKLYSILLAPIKNILPERLIIVPHGKLNDLPFEALSLKEDFLSIEELMKNKNVVLFKHTISYCPSANLLQEMQLTTKRKNIKKKLAVFKPKFDLRLSKQPGKQNLQSGLLSTRPFLTPFDHNLSKEVTSIYNKIRGTKIYSFEKATKEFFFKACEQFNNVHVPTHGILNEYDPSLSFIAFSQMTDTLNVSNLLFLKDLYDKNWQLDLVFFSACRTAEGPLLAGEGNISMARGLAYAGVRSFVTTLWNVPTDSKARIAPKFYHEYLNEGDSKDVSLTKAKRAVTSQFSHPVYWAGYILIGATE